VTQTTGILVHIDSASTALTGAGRVLLVDSTADFDDATGIVAEIKTVHTTGIGLQLTMDAVTDGFGVDGTFDALTTGEAFRLTSSATAITGAGRLFNIDHTGATSTSGVIAEFSSAANDETTIARITASAALALGVALDLSVAAMTTGTALDIGGAAAITTGKLIEAVASGTTQTTGILVNIESAATALTGAGRLLYVNHTGATTTSGTVAEIISASTDETDILVATGAGTGYEMTVRNTNAGAVGAELRLDHVSASAADNDVVGRIIFTADDEEGSPTNTQLCLIDVQWTDATAASYASDLEVTLATAAASNLALTLSGAGQMGLDLDSDLSASSAAGQIFDDYDDAMVLQRYAYLGVTEPSISLETIAELESMGIVEANAKNQRGYILKLQPFLRLLSGGIYQTRGMLDAFMEDVFNELREVKVELTALKAA